MAAARIAPLLVAVSATVATAQRIPPGHLRVTVIDQSGVVVASSQVEVTQKQTGSRSFTLAEANGEAEFDLAPGIYEIHITAAGFKGWTKQAEILAGQDASMAAQLAIAETWCSLPCRGFQFPPQIPVEPVLSGELIPPSPMQLLPLRAVRPHRHIF
jgi:Carboxypeptidase regulatory-like domain